MFGYSYRYIPGADGRRYCWTTEPIFACEANAALEDDGRMEKMAADLGVRVGWLKGKLRHMSDRKRDENGRLTNECANCGAHLKRLGFRRWIEAPGSDERTDVRISKRLGGDGFVTVEGPWFSPTKKDAIEWARGRVRQERTAA